MEGLRCFTAHPIWCSLHSNLIQRGYTHFIYDPLHRLIQADTPNKQILFAYDPLGRRISRRHFKKKGEEWKETSFEEYIYDGNHEIGTLQNGELINFRLLGRTVRPKQRQTIAIEIEGTPTIALTDTQGNICKRIKLSGREAASYSYTAFGEDLFPYYDKNPWRFGSKRLDFNLGLIDFGKRFYDPALGRWLTPDPARFHDSLNPYQYSFNNPYTFYDPDGEFAMAVAVPLAILFSPAVVPYVVGAAVAGVATVAVIEGARLIGEHTDLHFEVPAPLRDFVEECVDAAVGLVTHRKKMKNPPPDKEPPYNGKDLGDDPTQCPAEGFEWRGDGEVGSKHGGWYNSETKESLRQDFDHPEHKPHWDYQGPEREKARLYTDGVSEWK